MKTLERIFITLMLLTIAILGGKMIVDHMAWHNYISKKYSEMQDAEHMRSMQDIEQELQDLGLR